MNSFVLADPSQCIGCHTCEVACVVAHSGNRLFEQKNSDIAFYPRLSVVETNEVTAPVQCRHCEDAPCGNVCPNGSITKKGHGIGINQDTCIGCKTCMLVCPYGAISMVTVHRESPDRRQAGPRSNPAGGRSRKEKMVAHKCDLCEASGSGPECVRVCPTEALRLIVPDQIAASVAHKRMASAAVLQPFGGQSGC